MYNRKADRQSDTYKGGTAMTREAGFWTADKLDFLDRYIPAFLKATKKARGRYYVDGFAGPGTNRIDGRERNGSPLIALNADVSATGYFFVEKLSENFENLQKTVAEHSRGSKVQLYQEDFNRKVPEILAQIPDMAPTLFFLDPEGLELEFETVRQISRRTKSDLFILISGSGVTRNLYSPSAEKALTRFYGNEDWKEARRQYDEGEYAADRRRFEVFTDLYLSQLKDVGFNVVNRYLIARNSRNVALHALVFAIKSDKPQAALSISEDILRNLQSGTQGSLF